MNAFDESREVKAVIGIDVGGTKCAAGLVLFPKGEVAARRLQPTRPEREGAAILDDVIEIALSLQQEGEALGIEAVAIGVGVAELVGLSGRVLSEATIRWKGLAAAERLQLATQLPTQIEADVRAAARAEAHLGAGRPFSSFLYVTVGTGISANLVHDRVPYAGARGLTGTFASSSSLIPSENGGLATGPPLEHFAAGPAIARRFAQARPDLARTAADVVALAESGDVAAVAVIGSAGQALGAAIGQLVNMLDPEAVVLGGGLGLVNGLYRQSLDVTMREYIWSDLHRNLPLLSAEMGADAGFIGAAIATYYL